MAYQESLKTSRFLLCRLLGVSHLCLHTGSRHQRLEPGHLRSHHGPSMCEDERCPVSARVGGRTRPGAMSRSQCSGTLPGVWQSPRVTGKLRFARATHRGVQRGKAPLRFGLPPRVGDQRALIQPNA